MWGLIKFWGECAKKGWKVGGHLFAVIETGCALVAAGLLWRTQAYQGEWKSIEESTMKWAFIVVIASFLISTVLVAPYLQWKEQKGKNDELLKRRPRFREAASAIEFAPSANQPGVIGPPTLALKFTNSGEHGSIGMSGNITIVNEALNEELWSLPIEAKGEIGAGEPMNFYFPLESLSGNMDPFYIHVGMEYEDSKTGERFTQAVYLLWRGTQNGGGILGFFMATEAAQEGIDKYLIARGKKTYQPKKGPTPKGGESGSC